VNAETLKNEIYELAQKGTSIIFSTHRMEQVEEICDNIVLINKGKVVIEGSVKDVKNRFKENIFECSFNGQLSNDLQNKLPIVKLTDNNAQFKITNVQSTQNILKTLVDANVELTSFNEILPSLNEIFIKVKNVSTESASNVSKGRKPIEIRKMKFGSPKNYIIRVADKIFEKIKFIMQKLWLIIQREYTSRIRTRSFIIGTFLAPLLFAGFVFFQVKVMSVKDDNLKRIVVIDQGGFLNPDSMPKFSNILFTVINESEAAAKQQVNNKQYDALLIVPSLRDINDKKFAVSYFSDDKLGLVM
jgi:uncharacterized protein YlzI (FlbEa/FlbD family)